MTKLCPTLSKTKEEKITDKTYIESAQLGKTLYSDIGSFSLKDKVKYVV